MLKNRNYIAIASLFTLGIYYFGINKFRTSEIESLGNLGDFVGGNLNPILAFLSFLALLTTVRLQSEEMSESRKELKRSAEAQEKSQKILDQQYNTQIIQQFENTFFSLLNQIRDVEPTNLQVHMLIDSDQFTQNIKAARSQIHRSSDTYSHYFRLIYQTLKLIKTKSLNNSIIEAKFYTSILRSTLTPSQTKILAANSAILPKFKNDQYKFFKELIEEYCLLEHMHFYDSQGEIDEIALQIYACYDESSFGKNHQLMSLKSKNMSRIQQSINTVNSL